MNISGYPKLEPHTASQIFSNCMVAILTAVMSPQGDMDFNNKLIQEIWVTHAGKRIDLKHKTI